MHQSYSKTMLTNKLNIEKKVDLRKNNFINTYKAINKKDIEPKVEMPLEFQDLYLGKNMVDMDIYLVMVENYYHDLNKTH